MKKKLAICLAFLLSSCGGGAPDNTLSPTVASSGTRHGRLSGLAIVAGERRSYDFTYSSDKTLVGTSKVQTLVDFRLTSPEVRLQDISLTFDADGRSGQLYRLYQAAFGRTPDVRGFGYWKNAVENDSATIAAVAGAFLDSVESKALYGASSDDNTFVARLYGNVLGRTPDPAGTIYWTGVLKSGVKRTEVLLAFADSAENKTATAAAASHGMPFAEPSISYIPVSNATAPKDAPVGITVVLDGSASTDANDDKLNYVWSVSSKPSGSVASLNTLDPAKPTIKFDIPGTYQIALWTNDGKANSFSPAQLSVVAHGIVPDSGIYMCASINVDMATSLYSVGHTYLDRDKDGKPCTSLDVAYERAPPVATIPDSGTYKCSTISHEYAVLLYLQGHTYLDRDHDGKPCEATDITIEKTTYTPPPSTPSTGMCWVNGYTRSNGTHVNGYWRRC
jgi:hypothetical protein